ncbi:MAG TPA: hypothetical protein VGH16_23390 [Candidatus Binatia bacterium]
MRYFQPYAPPVDDAIAAAWDSRVQLAADDPWLEAALAAEGGALRPRFAECYRRLSALPRGARRAVQRRLAASRALAIPDARRRSLAFSLAGAALLLALAPAAQANDIIVSAKTPPNIQLGDNKCSLAEAIVASNLHGTYDACTAGSGTDIIHLPKGTQTLTKADGDCSGPTGLPAITSNITIEGNGAKIVRGKKAPAFRLLCVRTGAVTINDTTFSGGSADFGGGIVNSSALTLNNCVISGNVATGDGGGIYTEGSVHATGTTFSKNQANRGGALFAYDSIVQLADSLVTGNTAGRGGGIYVQESSVDITGGTISKNSAAENGGGVAAYGIIQKNYSPGYYYNGYYYGGYTYFYTNNYVRISGATITGNSAAQSGGGLFSYGSYIYTTGGALTKNSAGQNGGGAYGKSDTYFTLTNGVVSGNKAGQKGGGAAALNIYYGANLSGESFSKNKAAADAATNDTYVP